VFEKNDEHKTIAFPGKCKKQPFITQKLFSMGTKEKEIVVQAAFLFLLDFERRGRLVD